MRSLHLPLAEYAPLPVGEVRALHNLAMGVSRQMAEARGSTVWSDRPLRKHRYVFFLDSGGRVGDEGADHYLGVRVVKRAPREWHMSISFLENNLETAYSDSNVRELNSFIWNDELAFGMQRTREAIGKLLLTKPMGIGERAALVGGVDVGTYRESRAGLTIAVCDQIADRMLDALSASSSKVTIPTQAA